MANTSATDRVLLLSAQNDNGQSMVQVAKKGASQGARDKAAKIFCDNVVRRALISYKVIINSTHDETTARFILGNGRNHLKELSQTGLSQEVKDYILRAYLSTGFLDEAFYVAEFGASPQAVGELREAMIKDGHTWNLEKTAKLQGVPLSTREIDILVSVCVKKHLKLNMNILVGAVKFGASQKVREQIARKFVKEIRLSREDGSLDPIDDWDVLLEILGDCGSGPRELLNEAIKMITEDILKVSESESFLPNVGYEKLHSYTKYGVELVKLGASQHIADYFVQELVVGGAWKQEDAFVVAHYCSPMLVESLTRNILDKARAKRKDIQAGRARHSGYNGTDLNVLLKKLSQIAKYAGAELKKAVMEELLENRLTDEAVELSLTIG